MEFLSSFLRKVSMGPSFNLTATRTVSNWLSSALGGASSAFDELRTAVQSLNLATILRRGHHMSVLWRAFLPDGGDNELTDMERDLCEKLLSSYNSPGGLLDPCDYRLAYALVK